MGTSPRVRGKPHRRKRRRSVGRYIPASAGEAKSSAKPVLAGRVHPRECGGSSVPSNSRKDAPGTSPRVRGKPLSSILSTRGIRYIPASAGEALSRAFAYKSNKSMNRYVATPFYGSGFARTRNNPSYKVNSFGGSPSVRTPCRSTDPGAAHVITMEPCS